MRFIEISEDEFRAYAEVSPYQSFMQTPEIAKLRESEGWTVYYFGVTKSAQNTKSAKTSNAAKTQAGTKPQDLLAAALVVAKPTFLGKSTFICPGGPLMDYSDSRLVTFFLKSLKNYAKTHNGYTFTISPYYEKVERDRDGNKKSHGFDHSKTLSSIESAGFTEVPHASQPKYMFAMDINGRTSDQLLADFKRNTRNHVRKAEKMGVKVRELTREELPIFKKITESTSERRGFTDRPLKYYEKMYDLFSPRGEIKFLAAEIGAETETERGAELIAEPEGLRSAAARAEAREPRGDGRERRGPRAGNSSAPSSIPLSAAMFMLTGDEVVYLFSGSDERYMKDYNAQYLIQWEILKFAAEHGYKRYNFYGIHDLPKNGELDGIYEFKKGFDTTENAHVLEYLGTFNAGVNPFFYTLHNFLSRLIK